MKNKRNERGVTLIELLITVVIIGLVAGMAVPRFEIAMERIKVKSGNRDLISVFRMARSYAIADKEQYGLYIDSENRLVTLFKDITNPELLMLESADSVIRVDTLPREFNYIDTDCNNNVIAFKPNGSADFVGGGNVYAMATTENVCSIFTNNILASTGRISSESYIY